MGKNSFSYLNSEIRFFDGLFEEFKDILPNAGEERIWYHSSMNVYAAANSRRTYCALFGSYPELRGGLRKKINRFGNMISRRHWEGPLPSPLRIPGDSVLLSHGKNGIIVASVNEGIVLKIVTNAGSFNHLDNEISAWSLAKDAGIDHYVPRIIDHGKTVNGYRWMVSELAPNFQPVHKPISPFSNVRKKWKKVLQKNIIPVLRTFYKSAGIDISQVDELFEEEVRKIDRMNGQASLQKAVRLIENAGTFKGDRMIARGTVHGDLVPGHLHTNGREWRLIDWGLMHRTELPYEYFIDYLWHPLTKNTNSRAFWKWLNGDVQIPDLPEDVRDDIGLFLGWYNEWLDFQTCENLLRYQLLINTLRSIRIRIQDYNLNYMIAGNYHPDNLRSVHPLGRNAIRKLEALGVIKKSL